ncbi:hypothetical protein ABIC78_003623 [Novosphingobium sp. 1529]
MNVTLYVAKILPKMLSHRRPHHPAHNRYAARIRTLVSCRACCRGKR